MEVFESLRALVADIFELEPEEIGRDTAFDEDLYADSMDAMELAIMLEEEFGLQDLTEMDFSPYRTVGDVEALILHQ